VIRQVALIEVAPGAATTALEQALRETGPKLPGVVRSQLGRLLPGTVGGGAFTWDAWLDEAAPPLEAMLAGAALRSAVAACGARFDAVRFRPQCGRIAEPHIPRPIKRTLFLRVFPDTPRDRVLRFDADMCGMPDHIPAIRNWAYHHADPALHPTSWTHVWEQEYLELEGLQGDYMLSPYHWGFIDLYFDLESGVQIVDKKLAHVFYRAEGEGTILG
jgi:hypothetical protein